MRKRKLILAIFIVTLLNPFYAMTKERIKLHEKYKKWIEEEVAYIITSKERNVFLQLKTDRERDIFIEAFWKQRDPTSGTTRNEFKEEHYLRLSYANEYFGRGTPRPGWKTDQGRIYIVLGKPISIETYENVMNVYPTQIWFYLGDPKYGLPPAFNIVFFKKAGTGEYILYSPSDHGPQSLIADYLGDAKNIQDAYQRLAELEPNLAKHTLSLIPSERSVPGLVSLASNQLFSAVFSYPQRKVEDIYAEAILKYKDFVEVEYTANYIGSDAMVKVIRHDSGYYLIHYSVEPKKLSVDLYQDTYNAYFELDGRVTDLAGKTIFQYSKQIPLSLSKEQLQDLEAKSYSLQDMFPLVPGHYKFNLLVKNTVSKEFTSFESEVIIPHDVSIPQMSSLILGYRMDKSPGKFRDIVPFRIGENQILCQSRRTFARKEPLLIFFQVLGLSSDLKSQGVIRFIFFKEDQEFSSKIKKISEYQTEKDFIEEQSLDDFAPGYYSLKVSVLDKTGKEILSDSEDFEVTYAVDLPRPFVISKVMPSSRLEEYDYNIGIQLLNLGKAEEAFAFLEKAYHKNPSQLHYALGLSQVLFINGEYHKVEETLVPFLNTPDESEGVLYFLSKATHAMGQFQKALSYYEKYLSRFGVNLEILNLMGICHYKLGNTKEALKIWERSLEINPGQTEIKKLVESLKEKK
ncbi:MAG: GWxTD domain-containing protein [Candidatus Aenigmarchaeota archaeon]|nr:GWxTD domain-containing protein [Candidatus Aenigmarchaeota archaeon]